MHFYLDAINRAKPRCVLMQNVSLSPFNIHFDVIDRLQTVRRHNVVNGIGWSSPSVRRVVPVARHSKAPFFIAAVLEHPRLMPNRAAIDSAPRTKGPGILGCQGGVAFIELVSNDAALRKPASKVCHGVTHVRA